MRHALNNVAVTDAEVFVNSNPDSMEVNKLRDSLAKGTAHVSPGSPIRH